MKRVAYSTLVIAASLLMAACSASPNPTAYGEMVGDRGVRAFQISADTYRIEARGNGWTAGHAVRDYAMLKAAETARASGASHFDILQRNDLTETHVTRNDQFEKPAEELVIKIHSRPGSSSFSADEVIKSVSPRVWRG
jgi:hypothetical protein